MEFIVDNRYIMLSSAVNPDIAFLLGISAVLLAIAIVIFKRAESSFARILA